MSLKLNLSSCAFLLLNNIFSNFATVVTVTAVGTFHTVSQVEPAADVDQLSVSEKAVTYECQGLPVSIQGNNLNVLTCKVSSATPNASVNTTHNNIIDHHMEVINQEELPDWVDVQQILATWKPIVRQDIESRAEVERSQPDSQHQAVLDSVVEKVVENIRKYMPLSDCTEEDVVDRYREDGPMELDEDGDLVLTSFKIVTEYKPKLARFSIASRRSINATTCFRIDVITDSESEQPGPLLTGPGASQTGPPGPLGVKYDDRIKSDLSIPEDLRLFDEQS